MALYTFERKPVLHLGIRGDFYTKQEIVTLRISGKTNFMFYLDGAFYGDGPSRYLSSYPQYTSYTIPMEEGRHTLAVLLQYIDMETRLSDRVMDPFFFCTLLGENGAEIPLSLYYKALEGYDKDLSHRMATTFGILEWCADTTDLVSLTAQETDCTHWTKMQASDDFTVFDDPTRPVLHLWNSLQPLQAGELTEEFGYERDCAAARFFLRQLDDLKAPAQGIYRRYDLGSVKLVRPCFTLDLPKGATVEFAVSEQLAHGRVNPFLSLTGDVGTNLVHFKAVGGKQTFLPLTPLGGRYLELHIVCEQDQVGDVRLLEEGYYWRTFFDEAPGRFSCNRARLNDIWQMSVQTLRSCTEDVVTDCPVRERGQWTGDCSVVGLRTTSIAYGDMQVIQKSLLQAPGMADENGVIPALFPGQTGYFITYSLLWVCGLMDCYRSTGDSELLVRTYTAAKRFLDYMEHCFDTENGTLTNKGREIDCGFVDWGYEVPHGRMDVPVIGMYAMALDAFAEIQSVLKIADDHTAQMKQVVKTALVREAAQKTPEEIGYHGTVLLLKTGVLEACAREKAIAYLKHFVMGCFPNKKDAERLYSPTIVLKNIITPYFYNFTLWALMENGESAFVYDQMETCWGYMLDNGDTTCLEVFDHRWSHCHQWSGCPGWILTCYGLGLFKRYEWGKDHFVFDLQTDGLEYASGALPLADGSVVLISWKKQDGSLHYTVQPDHDIWIHFGDHICFCREKQETNFTLRWNEAKSEWETEQA